MTKGFHLIILAGILWCSLSARAQMHRYTTNFMLSERNFADTIPIVFEDGQLYVDAEMNGRRYRFNLDTGSSQGAVVGIAGLGHWVELGNVVSRDGAGHLDTVRVIQLPPFTLGSLTISDYVATVLPHRYGRHPYDAIIGFDVLNKGLCCKIDTRAGYMILTDRRHLFDHEPGYDVGYKLKWFAPYLLVSPFKRHVDEVLFDTGARQLYTMNKQSFDEHAYKSKQVEDQVEARVHGNLTIGTSGAEETDEVAFLRLDRLKWDNFAFKDVSAVTTQGASRLGAAILGYGTITIDPFRRNIRFAPYDGADSVVVGNKPLSTAYVPTDDGHAQVGLILPESDNYKAGLRQGDIILAIDGKAINTFEAFLNYPFVQGRKHRLFVRTKEGQNKEVTLVR